MIWETGRGVVWIPNAKVPTAGAGIVPVLTVAPHWTQAQQLPKRCLRCGQPGIACGAGTGAVGDIRETTRAVTAPEAAVDRELAGTTANACPWKKTRSSSQ